MKPIQFVQHRHVKRRRDRAFFLVAANVNVVMIRAAVGQPVNQPRVGMERKDHRFVFGKLRVEIRVAQSVRMFGLWLQSHQIDNIDDADFQLGQMLPHDRNGGQRF